MNKKDKKVSLETQNRIEMALGSAGCVMGFYFFFLDESSFWAVLKKPSQETVWEIT